MLPTLPFLIPILGKTGAGIATWLGGTAATVGAWEGMSRLLHGSTEDQIREQMRIGEKLEAERAAQRGGGQPMPAGGSEEELAALMGAGGGRRSLTDLMAEDEMLREVAKGSMALRKARNQRPYGSRELEDILAGQTARIASLQSERGLTPLEVIQMMEALGG